MSMKLRLPENDIHTVVGPGFVPQTEAHVPLLCLFLLSVIKLSLRHFGEAAALCLTTAVSKEIALCIKWLTAEDTES